MLKQRFYKSEYKALSCGGSSGQSSRWQENCSVQSTGRPVGCCCAVSTFGPTRKFFWHIKLLYVRELKVVKQFLQVEYGVKLVIRHFPNMSVTHVNRHLLLINYAFKILPACSNWVVFLNGQYKSSYQHCVEQTSTPFCTLFTIFTPGIFTFSFQAR